MRLEVPYASTFHSTKNLETTFAYLADYKSHLEKYFPGLETLEEKPGGIVIWRFKPIRYSSYALDLKASSKIRIEAPHTIALDAISEPNMSDLSGAWRLSAQEKSTSIRFTVTIAMDFPLPSFLRSMAEGVAGKEIKRLLDRYVENLEKALAE